MGVTKVEGGQLFNRLNRVFREHGYEGASLSRISKAIGLGKASLYHRFPGGKAEMVDALLVHVDETCMQDMLAPLQKAGPLRSRVKEMAGLIDDFYEGGRCSCLFETLTLGQDDMPFRPVVKRLFDNWLAALVSLALQSGCSKAEAQRRGEQALVEIQGGLVFARASGNTASFKRTIKRLPDLLLGADVR